MFKKMMICEKTWNKFAKWFYDNNFHLYFHNAFKCMTEKEQILVLNLMPTFMDEQKIDVAIFSWDTGLYSYIVRKKYIGNESCEDNIKTRQETLIKACEKAFNLAERK